MEALDMPLLRTRSPGPGLLVIVLLLVLLGDPAHAADGELFASDVVAAAARSSELAELLKPGPWEVEAWLTSLYLPDAQAASGPGEVDTLINRFRARFAKNMGMGSFLTLEAAYENRVYSFSGLEAVLPQQGVPTASFHGIGFRVRYLQAVNTEWAGFLFGRVRCEFEAGVEPVDGLSWVITPGVGRSFGSGLNLGMGVAIIDRIQGDLLIIPGPQFRWKINERWSTELVGTEFLLEHHFSKRWTLAFAAGFDSPRTRLNDSAPGSFGIFTDSRLPLQLRATWTPIDRMSLELRVGVDVYRELFFSDRFGNSVFSQRLDPSPHFGLRWNVRF